MGLQKKAVLFFNGFILITCICISVLGYWMANRGFSAALNAKAEADMRMAAEVLDLTYPGSWTNRDDGLYKGDKKMDDNSEFMDRLAELTGNNATLFKDSTRVATTFMKDGQRAVGTQASQPVIETVLQRGTKFSGEAEVLGNKYFSVYMPLKDINGANIGMLYMGIPTAAIDSLQSSYIHSMFLAAIFLLAVVGVLVWMMISRALQPILAAKEGVVQISQGDFSCADLDVHGKDEIAVLSQGINSMKQQLKKLMCGIAASAEQVAASSEELTASATQTADSIRQVAEDVIDMVEDTKRQSTDLLETSQQSADMGRQMTLLQQNSQQMQSVAEGSMQSAKNGRVAVHDAVGAMKKMADQMEKSSGVVASLGERSKEIGQIVDTISNIAEQTNLLALNAAIEAARAGDAGRGFAVVADEVRKLAEQSGTAAQNIAGLINSIQRDTNEAVTAMEQGNAEVASGTKIIYTTGEVFAEIERAVNELYQQIQKSLQGINEGDQKSKKIVGTIQQVEVVSCETSGKAQSISAATEEQTAMMSEISKASHSLALLAQNLQNEIAKFKV